MKELARIILLKPLYNLLIFFAAIIPGHSIGFAIILLTIVVRFLLFIPTRKSLVAQQKLQKLQPHLEELKQKHKDDQQGQAQAMLALYKEHGVSPAGACLPALVQLPVLFILYYVFRIGLSTSRFDLLYGFTPHPDAINTMFFGINLSQPDRWLLPLIAASFQFVASWQLRPPKKSDSSQIDVMGSFSKQMLYLFPVMTFAIGRTLPAALSLYWVATTVFSIGQQYFVNRNLKGLRLPESAVTQSEQTIEQKKLKSGVEVVVRKKKS